MNPEVHIGSDLLDILPTVLDVIISNISVVTHLLMQVL